MALILILGAYSLIIGEVALRLVAPVPLLPRFVTGAPYGVRMNIPNAQYWHTTEEMRVQVRINAQGMRADRDFPYAKPADTCRILLFGDSVMMGYEVNQKDTFAHLLETRLRAAGFKNEVLNLAVSGFGTAEMLIALESEGLKYQPDVVIFQWHSTDPKNNVESRLFEVKDHALEATGRTHLPGIAVRDWLSQFSVYNWAVQHSQLYTAIRERAASWYKKVIRTHRKFQVGGDTAQDRKTSKTPKKSAKELDLLLLQRAKQTVETAGARFLLFDTPGRISRTQFRSAFDLLPPDFLGKMTTLSPLADFEGAAGDDILLVREKGHGHYTELGNGLLTKAATGKLISSGWLDSCR